ncbi:CoA-binding protein [Pararhodonellum marinum]|uniref:CoA-binding protein n=1 Tax=Pararhodonellum marinum TaxID=2755358 RepID=UPI00188F1F27|nr:CoA-binding protein [Pararhodonellum marinum]
MKKTVIMGATTNPGRYAYMAAKMFSEKGYDFVPVGIKQGKLFGKEILDLKEKPQIKEVDTITLYIGPENQVEWEEYILSLEPRRIIFNPGTHNPSLMAKARKKNIEVLPACNLVMLSTGQF